MVLLRYEIVISPDAENDINNTYRYIAFELFQKETAEKYILGILETILKLSLHGGMIAVSANENLLRLFGPEVRTMQYKKMTIIYTVADNIVIVCRVVASSLIV
jgi:plasmid stabilization system protein ParE